MAIYKPIGKVIGAASAASGTTVHAKLSTTSWGLMLIRATATFSNTVLKSAAVAIWTAAALTTGVPTYTTFTDISGIYGISTKAGAQIKLKVYSK